MIKRIIKLSRMTTKIIIVIIKIIINKISFTFIVMGCG